MTLLLTLHPTVIRTPFFSVYLHLFSFRTPFIVISSALFSSHFPFIVISSEVEKSFYYLCTNLTANEKYFRKTFIYKGTIVP